MEKLKEYFILKYRQLKKLDSQQSQQANTVKITDDLTVDWKGWLSQKVENQKCENRQHH